MAFDPQGIATLREIVMRTKVVMMTTRDEDGQMGSRRLYALVKARATGDKDAIGENRKLRVT